MLGTVNNWANLREISNSIALWLGISPPDLFFYAVRGCWPAGSVWRWLLSGLGGCQPLLPLTSGPLLLRGALGPAEWQAARCLGLQTAGPGRRRARVTRRRPSPPAARPPPAQFLPPLLVDTAIRIDFFMFSKVGLG